MKCPICKKELNKEGEYLLLSEKCMIYMGSNEKEIEDLYLYGGLCYELFMRIGSCFYCDERRFNLTFGI